MQTFEDDFQTLAVGLEDGGIVLIDLILQLVKNIFPEKHPKAVSALNFWQDKVLVSGSVDGRIQLTDLENLENKNSNLSIMNKNLNNSSERFFGC